MTRHVMDLSDAAWEWLEEGARANGNFYKGQPSRTGFLEYLASRGVSEEKQGPKQVKHLPAPISTLAPEPVEGDPDYDEDDWEVVAEDEWDEIERVPVED